MQHGTRRNDKVEVSLVAKNLISDPIAASPIAKECLASNVIGRCPVAEALAQ